MDLMQFLEATLYEELQRKGMHQSVNMPLIDHKSLMIAEAATLQYYEHACALEQAEVDAAVAEMYGEESHAGTVEIDGGQSQVLCPQCKKNWLVQADGGRVFLCQCKFRLNVQHDGVSPEFLQQRLSEAYQQHKSSTCSHEPRFQVQNQFGAEVLCILCEPCGHFMVVV